MGLNDTYSVTLEIFSLLSVPL